MIGMLGFLVAALPAFALPLAGPGAGAGAISRASQAPGGAEPDSYSAWPSISADGNRIAFMSDAANLVLNDLNGLVDVFVVDRTTGVTLRVSTSPTGEADGVSDGPRISADGSCVAFVSDATNLVAGDTNGVSDVFVRDLASGVVTRVSVRTDGVEGNGAAISPALSTDGRFVAFEARATNFVPGVYPRNVFVHDRSNATTHLVNTDANGVPGESAGANPAISADGRYVAFECWSRFDPADDNGWGDVYVKDRTAGTIFRASLDDIGGTIYDANCESPAISADGRFVAFVTYASGVVPMDGNNRDDIFLRDTQLGVTTQVSIAPDGSTGTSDSRAPEISSDGGYVTFVSRATNLVQNDTNLHWDVFVRDLAANTTRRVSLSETGAEGPLNSSMPAISGQGRFVAFHTGAAFVASDVNATHDIYVHDRWSTAGSITCAGDGSGAPCPCGNTGSTGHGCGHSGNAAGALLRAAGNPSLLSDGLQLSASEMPQTMALLFQGTTALAGGAGLVFGDGLRCGGGSVMRLVTRPTVQGRLDYPGPTDPPVSVLGLVPGPGVRVYQVWYRNAADFCTSATFNWTNGIQVDWQT